MKRLTLLLLLSLLSGKILANEAQDLCVQQILASCIEKCETNGGSNCNDNCQENATNECLQAGE